MALATLADGIYCVVSAISPDSPFCLDVTNGSTSDGANVQLCAWNDTNAQKVKVTTNKDGTRSLAFVKSSKRMDVDGGVAVDGRNVQQWVSNSSRAQSWTISQVSESDVMAFGGANVPLFRVQSGVSTSLVLDVTGAQASYGTNIQIYSDNSTEAQRFAFVPTSAQGELAVPSWVRGSTTAGGNTSNCIMLDGGTGSIHPAWHCSGSSFQARYRIRYRLAGSQLWSGWGAWRGITSASTSTLGWETLASTSVTSSGDSHWLASGISISLTQVKGQYDKAEIEFDVRAFEASGSSTWGDVHGPDVSGVMSCCYKPVITFTSGLAFSPDGMMAAWKSSFLRGGVRLSIHSISVAGAILCSNVTMSSDGYADTITIPISSLAFVPADGATATIDWSYYTVDGVTYGTSSATVAYAASSGLTVIPTITYGEGAHVYAKITRHSTDECYLLVSHGHGDSFEACDVASSDTSTVSFRIIPPIGVPYRIFVVSRSSTAWGTYSKVMPAVVTRPRCHLFDWGDGEWAAIALSTDEGMPKQETTYKPDYSQLVTNGREHPITAFGRDMGIGDVASGVLVPLAQMGHSDKDHIDALAYAKHVVHRSPYGGWDRCAVTGATVEETTGDYSPVSVTMEVESV